MIDWINW